MAATLGILGTIASVAGTAAGAGTGIYSAVSAANRKAPQAQSVPQQDFNQMARTLLPGAKANLAAQTGGGASPQLLEGILGQQTGAPGGLDILGEIQKALGPGGTP